MLSNPSDIDAFFCQVELISACNFSLLSSCIGEASRKPAPIIVAMRWPCTTWKFFNVARLNKAPIAVEHIDALFAIERDINGKPRPERERGEQPAARRRDSCTTTATHT